MTPSLGSISSLRPPVAEASGLPGFSASGSPDSFAQRMESLLEQEGGERKLKTVREQSRKLVAEAFIAPILAKVRETNQAAEPFGTTDVEKRFGPIFDRAVADAMVRPDRFPMVEAVERSMLRKMMPQEGISA
ncbi:MAG: hypothetical protein CBC35_10855 [Planctomycetes bacterium TMED75]|nr:hypothetical protein [Planctomycetaceae bacterium]OUU90751.1 MAG: hypothetical protein CBC35_10855 [Planctomycetes bacterium TMED75]